MLQLINYDLPGHKYDELQAGVEHAGGGIHMLNGPWIYGANKPPQDVLMTLVGALKGKDEDDKLLVFPVQMGEISMGRNLEPQLPIKHRNGAKVMAIAYTLRNPEGPDHENPAAHLGHCGDLVSTLKSFGATCHPLGSLWFVKTDLSAHEVHLAIEKAVPLNPKDELMVAEVDLKAVMNGCPVKGAEEGLEPLDHNWLVEAGVL